MYLTAPKDKASCILPEEGFIWTSPVGAGTTKSHGEIWCGPSSVLTAESSKTMRVSKHSGCSSRRRRFPSTLSSSSGYPNSGEQMMLSSICKGCETPLCSNIWTQTCVTVWATAVCRLTLNTGTENKSQDKHQQMSPYHLSTSNNLESARHFRSATSFHMVPKLGRKEGNVRSYVSPGAPFPSHWHLGNWRRSQECPSHH